MDTTPDLQFQRDTAARLAADPYFSDLAVALVEDGYTEAEAAVALGPIRAGGNQTCQAGTLILINSTVDAPDEDKPNVPGPRETLNLTIRVSQTVKIAKLQTGYKPFNAIALRIKQLCHLWQIGPSPVTYTGAVPFNDGKGSVGKDVTIVWTPPTRRAPFVVQPRIEEAPAGKIALVCNNPAASVRYTLDGSYPGKGSPAYAAPIDKPAAGVLLRAVAYAPELMASGVSEQEF